MGSYHLRSANSAGYALAASPSDMSPGLSDYSISAWAKCSKTVFGGSANADLLVIFFNAVGATCQFRIRGDTGVFDYYVNTSTITGSKRVSDEKWHHVVMTCDRDSATGFKLYVDGAEDTAATGTKDPTPEVLVDIDSAVVYVSEYFDTTTAISGRVSQLRVYMTVLTSEQVAAIYNNGNGALVDETEFAAIADGWYSEVNDGSGTTVTGRVRGSGAWSASNLSMNGGAALSWQPGGVPFGGISQLSEATNDVWENW